MHNMYNNVENIINDVINMIMVTFYYGDQFSNKIQ